MYAINITHNPQVFVVIWQGVSGSQSTEDLIKQPDFSDKIKQLLGSLQQTQNQGAPTPGTDLHSLDQHIHVTVTLPCLI